MAVNPTEPTMADMQREIQSLRLLVDFPLADRDIVDLLSGSPDQIRAAAQKLHEQAVAANAVPPPAPAPAPVPAVQQVAPPAPGAAPAPVPGPGQVTPPESAPDARYQDLLFKVENKLADPMERQEFFMSALRNPWNEHAAKLNARVR